MLSASLHRALESVPAGQWAAGVSGGADSVALLALLRRRADLRLHVAHLDHETRGQASAGDAEFVTHLCAQWDLPCTIARRRDIEREMPALLRNPSARYRAARLALFAKVAREHALDGVMLAHHADDQAETVLHRLLRNSSAAALAGMSADSRVGGMRVLRPLLGVSREMLRAFLSGIDQPWREDASNASNDYLRNRLRRLLSEAPDITAALLDVQRACMELRNWSRQSAPTLEATFPAELLAELPDVLALESARRWLIERGVPAGEVVEPILRRLLAICSDAASPSRTHFPGAVLVRRRRGMIERAALTRL